jgi:hypothetical protein
MTAATALNTTRQLAADMLKRAAVVSRQLASRLEAGKAPKVIPARDATHREIVLENATVELTHPQLEAVRDMQRRESESGIEAQHV